MADVQNFNLTCGICDSELNAEIVSMAQAEFLADLFRRDHQHGDDVLRKYIDAQGKHPAWISDADDGDDDGDV